MAKSKLSPTKRATIPRLELLAALLTAHLVAYVTKALDTQPAKSICWSDSQVALGWINGPTEKWKQYVANRVQNIHEVCPETEWRFVGGVDNPADVVSRGASIVPVFITISGYMDRLFFKHV